MAVSAINVLLKNISGQYLIPYVPPATSTTNGLVKIGNGIDIDTNGVISIGASVTNSINAVNTKITNLTTTVSNNLNTSLNKNRPNWNAGEILASGATHTINRDGWILFRNSGTDQATWYIGGNVIGSNYGMPAYWQDCNSCLCPVSSGNTVRNTNGLCQFFPTL